MRPASDDAEQCEDRAAPEEDRNGGMREAVVVVEDEHADEGARGVSAEDEVAASNRHAPREDGLKRLGECRLGEVVGVVVGIAVHVLIWKGGDSDNSDARHEHAGVNVEVPDKNDATFGMESRTDSSIGVEKQKDDGLDVGLGVGAWAPLGKKLKANIGEIVVSSRETPV